MKQLVFDGPRRVRWGETAVPVLSAGNSALVEPVAVSTCDMDAVALSGLIRFKPGTPLGHEGVCRVIEVGSDVANVDAGDLVIVPWQISCGQCGRCLRGHNTYCEAVPAGSCYGWGPHVGRWGGFLADVIEVPYADQMLVPLPHGMDPTHASGLSDNLVDAWRSVVPPLRESPSGRVLIVGSALVDGGSIGIYATAFASDAAASEVVYVSPHAEHRDLAARLGATTVADLPDVSDLGYFDVMADTSGTPTGLTAALSSGGPHSTCTCTAGAVHRHVPPTIPMYEMYMNNISLRTGWVNTRSLIEEPMARLAGGAFDPTEIASVHVFDDAEAVFGEPFIKLILTEAPSSASAR